MQIVLVQTDGGEAIGITSIGTGFILNNDGYVITSSEVIDTGEQFIQDNESWGIAAVIPSPQMYRMLPIQEWFRQTISGLLL